MKKSCGLFFLFIFFLSFSIRATNHFPASGKVFGIVKDAKTTRPISFASIAVINTTDSSIAGNAITDSTGRFMADIPSFGTYYLKISFIGYEVLKTEEFTISTSQPKKFFGEIRMTPSSTALKTVNIEAKQERFVQKGDTVQFNANAYKTQPDASAEDLIVKMPGLNSDKSGNVTANGEQVKQVLVDGKPFFGDDPNMALKNLPADVIDKIQVYDKLSDQGQFTGFDDGQGSKSINIITKAGKNNGQFGKVYAGYGTDGRYLAGGNVNLFKGDRRFSIIELSNNINQQNFSMQDLLGVMGNNGGGGGGQYRGGGGHGGSSGGGYFSKGGGMSGSGGPGSFLVGQQSGISTTHSAGLNYSDKWGKKIKVSGSYFINFVNNANSAILSRQYITKLDSGLFYNENSGSGSDNTNHRFNFKLEYAIDSSNSIIITPRINLQQNAANSSVLGNSTRSENVLQSLTNNINSSKNAGYNFSNNLLFQHKFKKRGRTFSANIGTDGNDKNGSGYLYSLSEYYYPNDSTVLEQRSTQNTDGYTLSSNFSYTEQLDSSSQLQFNYSPSFTKNNTDKAVNNFDNYSYDYSLFDTSLSNKYNSTYMAHKAGVSYNLNKKKYFFTAGINLQNATLSGSQEFPTTFTIQKTFNSVLPNAMLNYKYSKGTNLRVIYRTSTNTPSVSQLQNVINNSNPLLLSTGNPNLKQNYEQMMTIRYGKSNHEKATGLFFFLYGNYTQNYIGNSTLIPIKDTITNEGLVLKRGSQLSRPVNLSGYWSLRSFFTYALPISKIKSNLNFNGGLTYNRIPGLINNATNLANNYNLNGGTGLSSSISEKLDFNLSYTANYSIVENTLQKQSNNNYFYHTISLKFNWLFRKGFVFNTNLNHTFYSGLSQNFNQNYLLWNASFGYKLFKNRSLEIKASVFDMLNQNNSISRTVTETYIEDNQTKVLNRYFMIVLTYNMKNFKKTEAPKP